MIEGQDTQAKASRLTYALVGGGSGAFIGDVHRKAIAMDGKAILAAGCFSQSYDNTLATGEAQEFAGSYTVDANTPPVWQLTVTATGNDPCSGLFVTAAEDCSGSRPPAPTLMPIQLAMAGMKRCISP